MIIHLLSGWFFPTVQAVTLIALAFAIGWRDRRWQTVWLPAAAAIGVGAAWITYWYLGSQQMLPDTAPLIFWVWVALLGLSLAIAVFGWPKTRWWRKLLSIIVIPLTVFCVALAANQWTGYYPTIDRAWDGLVSEPLPNETDAAMLAALRSTPQPQGRTVPIDVPNPISHFKHRVEYVYLPPQWFTGPTPPRLPVLVMIGGVITATQDWVRSGGALDTVTRYARTHNGEAPILLLMDPTGGFNNDTECVDGPRGMVDTRLTKELRPYLISTFDAESTAAGWGVAGWSMGGTCAIGFVTKHPDLFSTFLDISGDIGPNAGNKQKTIAALYGGNAAAWAANDPSTVMATHGPYNGVSGWFQTEGHWSRRLGAYDSAQIRATRQLSAIAEQNGIITVVRTMRGTHTWPFAERAFADALPWLMQRLHQPGR